MVIRVENFVQSFFNDLPLLNHIFQVFNTPLDAESIVGRSMIDGFFFQILKQFFWVSQKSSTNSTWIIARVAPDQMKE